MGVAWRSWVGPGWAGGSGHRCGGAGVGQGTDIEEPGHRRGELGWAGGSSAGRHRQTGGAPVAAVCRPGRLREEVS
jgi:hypothetical protein